MKLAPAVHTKDAAPFDTETIVFACLHDDACEARQATGPARAYFCAEGHQGVLCASCKPDYYLKSDRCRRCDDEPLSPVLIGVVAAAAAGAVAFAVYRWTARRHSPAMIRQLHIMRKALKEARKEQQRRNRQRRSRRAARAGKAMLGRACERWTLRVKKAAVFATHEAVTSARDQLVSLGGESTRIVLNASKCFSHLYTTLPVKVFWQQNTPFTTKALCCAASA